MEIAVIVIGIGIILFSFWGMFAAGHPNSGNADEQNGGLKQKLIDINKVPDPKGRGTVWTPSE